MRRQNINRWELHLREWGNCTRCELHKTRQSVVLLRGDIPCDVLFIGEAPGHSEDSRGIPFDGDAGSFFQERILEPTVPKIVKYALSNLIACIPLDKDMNKTEKPPEESVRACGDRLIDLVAFCKPKLIVCVGKDSQHYLNVQYLKRIKVGDKIPRLDIVHPSWIMRQLFSSQPNHIKRVCIEIRDAINEHILKKKKA